MNFSGISRISAAIGVEDECERISDPQRGEYDKTRLKYFAEMYMLNVIYTCRF